MANTLSNINRPAEKVKFSVALKSEKYQELINNTLRNPKLAAAFIANISTAVAMNPALNDCTPASVLSAGLVAETLKLPLTSSFGRAYLVPFNQKKKNADGTWESVKVCQFQVGWRGYIDLALRTSAYRYITTTEVREGEYLGKDPVTAEPKFMFIADDDERESKQVVGYMASFQLNTGFTKTLYFSKTKMENHAKAYSQAYRTDLEKNTNNSFWSKDFDEMAKKTMIRLLISKWGSVSVDFQNGYAADMAEIKDDGTKTYIDNDDAEEETSTELTPEEKQALSISDLK